MADNGPISVSAPNTDLRTATGSNITFNTRYPFYKLDSTNTDSFQLINILFLTEPSNPDGSLVFYKRNLIYSFAHGYNYVPSTWFLVSKDSFTSALGSEGVYLNGGGASAPLASSVFIATADSTNVNFYVDKYWNNTSGIIAAPTVLGYNVVVRSYVAVNDLAGTDVPTQA